MEIMTRRTMMGAAMGASRLRARPKKPVNVVFIMTDDHGAWALNCYGCKDLHTPNVDRLAAGGVKFSRAFACTPVCSASRATYLTGRLPSHHGIQDFLQNPDSFGPTSRQFLENQPTISATLAQHGYIAGLSGKWHMGHDEQAQAGFSYWACVPGGASLFKDVVFYKNGTRVHSEGFKDDRVADYGIEFIEANKDRPFFLFLSFFAPHKPYNYQPEEDRKWYENSRFPCFPDEPIHPWHTRRLNGRPFPTLTDFSNRNSKLGYSALVTAMDRNVGRVLDRLDQLGLRDNTVVVFTADQGHCCGHHGIWGKGNSTLPLNLYDTVLQVPLIWSQPGVIPAGRVVDRMVSAYDFMPTLLDYLGVPLPKDPHRAGRSYKELLRGGSPRWTNEVYFEYEYVRGVRTENLKYIERTPEWPSELFDLESDPGERTNVLDDSRQRRQAEAVKKRMHTYFQARGAPPLQDWRQTTRQIIAEYGR